MRIGAFVESRFSSRRLPGKNAKPILGQPMLSRLLERLKQSRLVDVVCVATSDETSDDLIEEIALHSGASCCRGSLDDVLLRVLNAAKSNNVDVIVEITGDCPLVDAKIVDATVKRYLKGDFDYVTNILDRLTFPIGFDVQVFSTKVLEQVSKLTEDPMDRSNVTSYIYHHSDQFKLLNLFAPAKLDRPKYRLCVDYPEDFSVISQIYESLYPANKYFSCYDIVSFLDDNLELSRKNTNGENLFEFPTSNGRARQEEMDIG